MARKKRTVPGYNASSTADIAFMLLLFFLLTTTMDTDEGLPRRLPNPPDPNNIQDIQVNQRNLLQVMVSSDNRIMCAGEEVSLAGLRDKAKEFIENPTNAENLPEKFLVDVPFFGETWVTEKHVISLQCDRGTKYQTYIDVQNELAAAYSDLRNEAAMRQFNKDFKSITDDQREAITQKLYKQVISEAEPKRYGAN